MVRALDQAGVLVDNIEVRRPSLDDVFFSLTGQPIDDGTTGDPELKESRDEHHHRSPHRRCASVPRGVAPRIRGHISDVWALTKRNLVHIRREPMQLSDVTIQPVLFTLLFIFVFGSGIPIPDGTYKDFALAGLLTLNLTTSTMGTAVGLSTDLHEGVIERFRTLPMWRAAVLVGRSVADVMSATLCVTIVALTGSAIGWRPPTRSPRSSPVSRSPCSSATASRGWLPVSG